MNELLPIIRRVRRPLIVDGRQVAPAGAALDSTTLPSVPPAADQTEKSPPEKHDDVAEN